MKETTEEKTKPHKRAHRVFNLPNAITVSRLLLLPLLFFVFPTNNNFLIIFLMAAIFASDIADGFLARLWRTTSTLGKVLDHAVDKFVMVGFILLLSLFREMPWWVLGFFLLREALASVVGIFLLRRKVEISGSNLLGKATGFFFGVTSIAYVVLFPYREVFLWITVGFAVLASGSYVYYHFMRKARA